MFAFNYGLLVSGTLHTPTWFSLTHIYIMSYECKFTCLNVSALHCRLQTA